ncbi:MAG: OpgC domain-containing protein [Bradyrhizobium sp.]
MTDPAQARASNPDRDRRDLRLDACRGLALWFIFLDHIPENAFSWLTPRNYGFSDTSEVFVFVSRYTCMLAYGGALRDQGWLTTVARALRRSSEIYAAFLLLLVAYLAVIWALGGGSRYLDETNTAVFFENPGRAIVHAILMQYTPVNTDILPTFVLLHLAFPGLLWVLSRSAAFALGGSVLLYVLVQVFGWDLPGWPSGQWFFNPLAWQVLFVFGAWYARPGARQLRMLQSRAALALALLYLAFSLAVALSWHFKVLETFMPEVLSRLIYPVDKSNLSPWRLMHFLAVATVFVRLIETGSRGPVAPLLTALIRCGENSLAMYCFGVLLSLSAHAILVESSGGIAMQGVVSIAGIILMIVASTMLTWEAGFDRRGPKLF